MANYKHSYWLTVFLGAFILLTTTGCGSEQTKGTQYSQMLEDMNQLSNDFTLLSTQRQEKLYPGDESKSDTPTILARMQDIGKKAATAEGIDVKDVDKLEEIVFDIGKGLTEYSHSDEARITRAALETGDMIVNTEPANDTQRYNMLLGYKGAMEKLMKETTGHEDFITKIDKSEAFRSDGQPARYLNAMATDMVEAYKKVKAEAGNLTPGNADEYMHIQHMHIRYINDETKLHERYFFAALASLLPTVIGALGGGGGDGKESFLGGIVKTILPIGKQLLGGLGGVISNIFGGGNQEAAAAPAAQETTQPDTIPATIITEAATPIATMRQPVQFPFANPYQIYNYTPHYFPQYSQSSPLPKPENPQFGGYDQYKTYGTDVFSKPTYNPGYMGNGYPYPQYPYSQQYPQYPYSQQYPQQYPYSQQ